MLLAETFTFKCFPNPVKKGVGDESVFSPQQSLIFCKNGVYKKLEGKEILKLAPSTHHTRNVTSGMWEQRHRHMDALCLYVPWTMCM